MLRNSLDPDLDAGVFWIRIEIFGRIWIQIRFQWIRRRNAAFKHLFSAVIQMIYLQVVVTYDLAL